MRVKQIIDEDFVNFKTPSMVIIFPRCKGWKCGQHLCHNNTLAQMPDINIAADEIVRRYLGNHISTALVCSGLEPLDSNADLCNLMVAFRNATPDPIVIYTGYSEELVVKHYRHLYNIRNVIVKFGSYIPGHQPHYDAVLGVSLPSDNQYAKQIS